MLQFFVYGDTTLISFVELPPCSDSPDGEARIIARDITGKYCWDSRLMFQRDQPTGRFKGVLPKLLMENRQAVAAQQPVIFWPQSQYDRAPGQLPSSFRHRSLTLGVDMLAQTLQYIGETSEECLAFPHTSLDRPFPPLSGMAERGREMADVLTAQDQAESAYCAGTVSAAMLSESCRPGTVPRSRGTFHRCRLMMSHLGYFSWESRRSLHLLEKSNQMLQRLRNLDRNAGSRDYHKIGVVYVAPGQDDARSILANSRGSKLYEDFIAGLGWEVDLQRHTGFTGMLEIKNAQLQMPYYATSTMEVFFHVATRMPSGPDEDAARHAKIKHIGNDAVQIVWTEHSREYRRDIIRSNVTEVVIVIVPLVNGLFSIRLLCDPTFPLLGPLFDGAIVDKNNLAPLVRATAIHASRASLTRKDGFVLYYQQRKKYLEEIVREHRHPSTFEQFLATTVGTEPVVADAEQQGSPDRSTPCSALMHSDSSMLTDTV